MNTHLKIGLSLAFATMMGLNAKAQKIESPARTNTVTTFAIVVDSKTYIQARAEITAYKTALENQGLGTYIVAHDWKKPEEIRSVLQKLYSQKVKLEGAVLVGDIPIPMIMNAQRLTSAYRLDENRNGMKAAVPSDRFYDDFKLKFDFLKQDSIRTEQFFYSLSPTAVPVIHMDIYTARIKPSYVKGKTKYEVIRDYLKKVVAEKNEQNKLNNVMVYSGMGYGSESQTQWASEQVTLKEQLPLAFRPGGSAKFINSRMQGDLKSGLLAEIQREDLDLAIFHQHGDSDMQLVSGSPNVSFPQPSIDNVRRYLRSKIQMSKRDGRDIAETKKRFQATLGVPMAWMDDALVDSVVKIDSLFEVNSNIYMEDIDKITPNARMVILDNCYNGSFHKDEYMSGHYIFGTGKTILTMANSINVLQDVWTTNMIGLLHHGVRAGNWFKQQPYLETHLIGDPTLAYSTNNQVDYNQAMVNYDGNNQFWSDLLRSNYADLQSLALYKITATKGAAGSSLVKATYYNTDFAATRAQAFTVLSQLNTADFPVVLKDAVNDPYEYIRRKAVNLIGDFGGDEYVPALVKSSIEDWASKRVGYNLSNTLSFMNSETVIRELQSSLTQPAYSTRQPDIQKLIERQQRTLEKVKKDMALIADNKAEVKKRSFNVVTLRTYSYHQHIPAAIKILLDSNEDKALRLTAAEALGWYIYSYEKANILTALDTVINDTKTNEKLKKEAQRSKSSLLAYTPSVNQTTAAK